jgi:hypothetical protein
LNVSFKRKSKAIRPHQIFLKNKNLVNDRLSVTAVFEEPTTQATILEMKRVLGVWQKIASESGLDKI